ncbi:hypothetical protein DEU56DRAFT_190589 [Suillus clintonianus]|uniref:uncharacterized protein n=1 Tax=Suillus clintonianus TaxID=1904413 RepID=UPI001B870CC2|nr:uncharacterized protein DEU56DRAFT_190589 [Suillus clintonianus]KAG2113967.1 hypothetical protein DEU56DRAFT_190589 [Suillus clintonianus]
MKGRPLHQSLKYPRRPNPYDPTNSLDDISGFHWALHEFLQSRMHESDPDKQRLYFATGYGLIQCVKVLGWHSSGRYSTCVPPSPYTTN